ncbi:MAG: response regulator [Lentisphaerota bacterium]
MTETTTKKVLLADDEPLARLVGRKSLEAVGCFVVEAESCAQAESLWRSGVYDLVVLDHRMEDGLGLDLLKKMRGEGFLQSVLYLTADAEEFTPELCKDLQIVRVLSKPLDTAALGDAALSAPVSTAGSGSGPQYRGRFLVAPAGAVLTPSSILNLKQEHAGAHWLALDVHECVEISPDVLKVVEDWAQECRRYGGRLCLAGVQPGVMARLRELRADREVDLLPDGRALEALGRRLSSSSERLSLLDSVVRPV